MRVGECEAAVVLLGVEGVEVAEFGGRGGHAVHGELVLDLGEQLGGVEDAGGGSGQPAF